MRPGTYDDPFAIDDSAPADRPAPAARPLRKPATPYGIQPVPGGLVRAPGTPLDAGATPAAVAATAAAEGPTAAGQPAGPIAPPPAAASLPAPAPITPPVSASVSASARPGQPRPWLRRHEAFCHHFVLYGNASRAALEAGYSVLACKNQGYRLLRRPEVKARIAAIHRAMGADITRDFDVLLGKLEAVYRRAVDGGYLNAAARVVELQARMAGRLAARGPVDDDQ